jgi:PAS domain S-box-containing protein
MKANGEVRDVETRLKRKDGTPVWVSINASPISYGGQQAVMGTIQDITERKKAEERIQKLMESVQQEKDRLSALVSSIPDEVWFVDSQKKIELVNSSVLNELGQDTVKGINIEDIARSLEVYRSEGTPRPVEETPLLRALKGELLTNFEEVIRTPVSGELRYRQVSTAPVKDSHGNIIGSVAVVRDITERKQAEEELREIRDYLDNLFNYANAPIIVWNPDFEITRFNHAFEHLTGRTASEVMGKKLDILFPDDSRDQSMDFIRKTLVGERWDVVEIPILHRNGTIRVVLWNSAIIYASDGKTAVATIAQGQDITDRKKAEEGLRESEAKYRKLFDASPEAIVLYRYILNEAGEVIDFIFNDLNAAVEKATRTDRENLISKSFSQIFGKELTKRYLPSVNKMGRENNYVSYEDPKNYVEQLDKCFMSLYVPFDNERFFALTIDITELKKSEKALKKYSQELEAANKDLEAFGYSVTHDMKHPLRALGSFSELLSEDYKDKLDETGKYYLDRITKASHFISELTEDMLKLSRITRAEMVREQVDLGAITQSTIEDFRASQPSRQVEIIIAPSLMVSGDIQLLNIALRNLIENAWKFNLKCEITHIEIGTLEKDGEKVYFIQDNGIGFDMRYQDKLFQPFQRLTTDKDYPGTGIGLAIVQRVISRHGGKVGGSRTGKGSYFLFHLDLKGAAKYER